MHDYLNDHQKEAVEALQNLKMVFDKNHIQYFLVEGSALGAVRHRGFIPWDDDIDIGVFYKDQEKISHLLEKELKPPYEWVDHRVNSKFPRLYGKILCNKIGCIDIFPLIKTSKHIWGRRFQWSMRKILFKLYKSKIGYMNEKEINGITNKIKNYSAKFISILISENTLMKMISWNENLFGETKVSYYYVNLYGAYTMQRETIQAEWLKCSSNVEYEGDIYPSVSNLDAYLTNLYGDYITLPNENDRQSRHGEKF